MGFMGSEHGTKYSGIYLDMQGWVCHYDDVVQVVYSCSHEDANVREDIDLAREEKRCRDRLKKKQDSAKPKTGLCNSKLLGALL